MLERSSTHTRELNMLESALIKDRKGGGVCRGAEGY